MNRCRKRFRIFSQAIGEMMVPGNAGSVADGLPQQAGKAVAP
jgi:hypothetical protein